MNLVVYCALTRTVELRLFEHIGIGGYLDNWYEACAITILVALLHVLLGS